MRIKLSTDQVCALTLFVGEMESGDAPQVEAAWQGYTLRFKGADREALRRELSCAAASGKRLTSLLWEAGKRSKSARIARSAELLAVLADQVSCK